MFRIEYKIITERLQEIEYISDEEIRYDFLLGNVSFFSFNAEIKSEWEWIPLLDFAYCLQMIVGDLKINDTAKEYFEFTENAETLGFLRQKEQLKIVASFSPAVIETTFTDFEKAVDDFHLNISKYIRKNILGEPPSALQKYLSIKL
ncbi:hypothetical protein [Chryseobacterium profundimaris]|uniref:Uncharacterized protein n=1 Tax=Chryseobacterium profundimaris TaxID=1387275 RepID=A0ABY1P9A4_9FLAO|nr:hypothetical protein [Chryseobacterium profundimaris]SMP29210.1 hypothetical protein SAMN06264346_11186 [Chryseobacterium profundimaris]